MKLSFGRAQRIGHFEADEWLREEGEKGKKLLEKDDMIG